MFKLLLLVLKIKFKLPVVVESLAQSSEDLPDHLTRRPFSPPSLSSKLTALCFRHIPPTLHPWPCVGKG